MSTKESISEGKQASKGLIGAGIFSAIAASLCCITPVLALIAGSSGAAASFSWLEPARPFMIGITVLVLGFAWWQKLKPKKVDQIDCDCEVDEKPSFMQSKKFLGIVTVFAAFMLAFPYYSHVFYPETTANAGIVESSNIQETSFQITGMTCTGCEEHIKHAVAQLPGFIEANANYENSSAAVKFDKSKSTIEEVIAAINETGYTVSEHTNN
ncbi:MAG: mercuric transport protein MerTP [Flavobacteriales bacterium]|nr:mercuric transport protein MerTP [Flavobacteriales bacterium]